MRKLMMFLRTFRKARALGFTFVDAMRAARVNSYGLNPARGAWVIAS